MTSLIALLLLAQTYVFEAERVRSDATGKVLNRNWIRIRADGAHVSTEGMWLLPFITGTRIDYPDWRSEAYIDLLPFWKQDGGKAVPGAYKAERNCVLDSESTVLYMEAVEGYQAVVVRRRVMSHRQITNWYVPALGCESLKATEELIRPDGKAVLVSQTRTAWIRKR
jgi:hypothetical protein